MGWERFWENVELGMRIKYPEKQVTILKDRRCLVCGRWMKLGEGYVPQLMVGESVVVCLIHRECLGGFEKLLEKMGVRAVRAVIGHGG